MSDPSYHTTRFTPDPRRAAVWRHLARYLARFIRPADDVLELGAGYCDFANAVDARSVTALDAEPTFTAHAAPHVRAIVGRADDLSAFADTSFDVVFASNLLEHLDREPLARTLAETKRVLRPGGRLVLVQPNYRLRPKEYFDD